MELVPPPKSGRRFAREVVAGLADATASRRVRLDAIARWLQDVAYADIAAAGLATHGAWIVRRARLCVDSFPRFGDPVLLRTFCSGAGRAAAECRTSVSGGDAAVEAVATWIHVDGRRLRPLRLGREFDAVYGESAGDRGADFRLRHRDPPPDAPAAWPWRFRAADVDVAGHVNNAAYWAAVEERFAPDGEPASVDLEIEYREPAQPGEAQIVCAGSMMWLCGRGRSVHASIAGLPHATGAEAPLPGL